MLRLYLANDRGIRDAGVSAELFSLPEHRAAFELIDALIGPLGSDAVPDLGSAIGSDDRPEAELLRTLALQRRPLADASDVTKRLKQEAVERQIDALQMELAAVDANSDPQGYSDRFERLIALQNERRQLRSRE